MKEEFNQVASQEEFEKEIKYSYGLYEEPVGKDRENLLKIAKKAEELDKDSYTRKTSCGWFSKLSIISKLFRCELNLVKRNAKDDCIFIFDNGVGYAIALHKKQYIGQSDKLYVNRLYFE